VFSRPWLDGPTALAAVLAQSGRMTLATTVAVPVLRGPAATAKILAALDLLSGGRLLVGLGPGSSARDYELVGVSFEERWKRLDEAVQTLRAYWRADDVAFEGTFYSSAGFTLRPDAAQRPGPPIWIGSWGSAAGLRRVARLADGWLASGYNTNPELFAQAWADVQAETGGARAGCGRFPNGIATMWCYVTDDRARADAMLDGRAGAVARSSGGAAPFDSPHRLCGGLRAEAAGVRAGGARNASSSGRSPTSAPSSSVPRTCCATARCREGIAPGRAFAVSAAARRHTQGALR
jgi:alkanesulfonate monooxygenase SsuD/methylene tetrahydromethanopterin reductase-like flavin-dependent oxidoreductase (luciferase family)